MTERRLRFFATPREFDALVWPVAAAEGFWVVPWLTVEWPPADEPAFAVVRDATLAADGHHDRIHLSGHSEAAREAGIGRQVAAAGEGWITIELPLILEGALYRAEVVGSSGRSTSKDAADPLTAEILRLFRVVTKPIRPRLRYPTWAENVVHGGSGAYRTLGYTEEAARFEVAGGTLRDRLSRNLRYSTSPIPSERRLS